MLNARNSFVLAAVVLFLGGPVAAQPDDVHVPPPLESWRAWVLQGEEFRECPFFMQRPAGERASHVCAWPGVLVLSIDQLDSKPVGFIPGDFSSLVLFVSGETAEHLHPSSVEHLANE